MKYPTRVPLKVDGVRIVTNERIGAIQDILDRLPPFGMLTSSSRQVVIGLQRELKLLREQGRNQEARIRTNEQVEQVDGARGIARAFYDLFWHSMFLCTPSGIRTSRLAH
jgi:hypothetical protein